MTKKAIAKTRPQELAPSYIKQNTNRGNENVGQDDIQLPRIDVLQGLSPQLNSKKGQYIEGGQIGMLFNTLTSELYPDDLEVTPVFFVKRYLVWVDREKDKEGGLRGVFDTSFEAERFVASDPDSAKLQVVPTAEHLLLLADGTEVILSMAKSKLKESRKFNALVRLKGGDRFGHTYTLTTYDDTGPKGEFQNVKLMPKAYPSEEVYLKAEQLYADITAGTVTRGGDYSDAVEGEVENAEDSVAEGGTERY